MLPIGWWEGSISNFAAAFVGVEREAQGIPSCHPLGLSCIEQGMLLIMTLSVSRVCFLFLHDS